MQSSTHELERNMQAAYETAIHNGTKYVTTTSKGTQYCLHRLGGKWFVSSRRLALRGNTGGGKYYETFDDVRAGCKAFAALPLTSAI
jgi:hypothetical protein